MNKNNWIKKNSIVALMTIFYIVLFSSCGSRKNTATGRFYHSLNSRYNIYFNGKTSYNEALKNLNENYKDNYSEQLYMFPVSGTYKEEKTQDGGPFNRAIDKGQKAIKLHSIKEKPPRKPGWQNDPKQVKLQAQEEFNPFMKHCWILIAESQYYNGDFLTSAVTFSYIARHFTTDPDLVAQARIWQARCYTEMQWYYETNNALRKLNEAGVPPKQQKNYDRMYADYKIRSEQLEEAVPFLQKTIRSEKNKRQRSRMRYLLGQVYTSLDKKDLAYVTFNKLASSNPPYEIEFAARIRQTEVFPGGNFNKVLKMLRRMTRNDKNKDYLDQVYYAMGNLYMSKQDTVKAIEAYSLGVEKSTQNGFDKAICEIRLGDIYFAQKDYMNAQPCYSNAMSALHKEYKDYDRVSKLSATLDELVIHYEAVHLQDSLQELALMPEKDRLAAIDKIIEQVIENEKKAAEEAEKQDYIAQQEAIGSNLNVGGQITMPTTTTGKNDNAFYFYNTQTVEQGKTQFQNKWGKRTLEDNWRRRDKKTTLLQDNPDLTENTDNQMPVSDPDQIAQNDSIDTETDAVSSDPKTREYYLQQIPLTEEDMDASNIIVADGLFNMGMIYKDKLEDIKLSVETFELLENRFPDNEYRLEYYYHIYLMALRYKDTALSEFYKNKLTQEFPESDYTVAISDPDYEYNMRMMDRVQDSVYQYTYEKYLEEDTSAVRKTYSDFSSKYPLSVLMPKFMFLNALTYVQEGDAEGFKDALTQLTNKYPAADVSELANEMLKGLLRGRKLMQGSFSSMTWNIRFGVGEEGLSAADSARMFDSEKETPYQMLLIYTTGSIDRNQLLYTIAAYNFSRFRIKGFDINFEDIGSLTIMKITGFNNYIEIMDYYNMIYDHDGYATALDDIVSFFPISVNNYDVLMKGKTLEEYMSFFVEAFGDSSPELVNRWTVRLDEDRKEVEEIQKQESKDISSGKEESNKNSEKSNETFEEIYTSGQENSSMAQTETNLTDSVEIKPIEARENIRTTSTPEDEQKETNVSEDESERPKAKRENIFRRLFKKVKDTKEYKTIEEGFTTVKTMAEEEIRTATDTTKVKEEEKPLERVDGELTLDQIKEIRQKEAEEKASHDAEQALSAKEAAEIAAEQKKQQAEEREQLRKKKEKETKERLIQREKDRKAKEKEIKQRQKEKDKERKAKEKARKKAQSNRSKASKDKKK
jgi:tetratricopeptide (TPR) repeat protein